MTVFGNRVFADIISCDDWCPSKKRNRPTETQTHIESATWKWEAETGVVCLQAEDPGIASGHQQPGDGPGTGSPSKPPELRKNTLLFFQATQFVRLCYGGP